MQGFSNLEMEESLQWLVKQQEEMQKTLQSFQQSPHMERQTLRIWQAEQQKSLWDFIREQANIQQQLLQKVVGPVVGDGNRTEGLALCKMGPADDAGAFWGIF